MQRGLEVCVSFGASLRPVGATGRSPHGYQVKAVAWGKPSRKLAGRPRLGLKAPD